MVFADVIKKCIVTITDVCQIGSIKARNPALHDRGEAVRLLGGTRRGLVPRTVLVLPGAHPRTLA